MERELRRAAIPWRAIVMPVFVAACCGCAQLGFAEDESLAERQAEMRQACSGTWITKGRPCACPAGFLLNTPSCELADCRHSDVLVLSSGSQSVSLQVQHSPARQRFSAVGPLLSRGGWSITPELELQQKFASRDYTTSAQCDGDALVRAGTFRYRRARPSLTAAVAASLRTEEWTDVRY